MNRTETAHLCRLVKAYCPAQAFDEFSVEAWQTLLGRFAYADAKTAIEEIAGQQLEPGKSRYIEPGHIIGGIHRIRARRLEETPMPPPPAELESAAEQIAWQRRTREQIAAGTYVAPTVAPAMANPDVRRQMLAAAHVEAAPPEARHELGPAADVRPRMTEAEMDAERNRQLALLAERVKP